MKLFVLLVGVLIAVIGLVGVGRPAILTGLLLGWAARGGFWLAVIIRLVIGVLFLIAAPGTRVPALVQVVGALTLFAVVVLLLMGPQRLSSFVHWWGRRSGSVVRIWSVAAVLFGGVLIYAAG